jgi:glycosyltransferase involved in cell wall biosynthesis
MSGQASSGDRPWSIVLASREVWPFVEGGGIGRYMWATARALAPLADVSIVTSSNWRERYDELVRAGDERIGTDVRFAFVDEPSGDLSPFVTWNHLWSLRLLEGVARLHPGGGPDILEMADYQAEGFAAAHARRGHDPRLRNSTLAIGLHTSAEMCAVFDELPSGQHMLVLAGLERFALRFADVLLWPGGNSLEGYADFYGSDALAPAIFRPLPAPADLPSPVPLEESPAGPLRLLYLNRLQALKGVTELIAAVRSLPDADITLTLVGRDTMTGPNGSSMQAHVEALIADDPRIELRGQVPHADVPTVIARHHAVVVPSRWESSPYVVREALGCNRPVIATPVGWVPEAVRTGESGWLARSSAPDDLAAVLSEVLAARGALARMIAEGRPRAVFEELAAQETAVHVYEELLNRAGKGKVSSRPRGAAPASVDALVACDAGGGDPLPTLLSLEGQRDVAVDTVLVVGASGGFPGPGPALARARLVVSNPDAGNGRDGAWTAGLGETSADLVLVLPAGAVLGPDFLQRAAAALADEPALSWVTSLVGEGAGLSVAPLGSLSLPDSAIEALTSIALVRRSALETVLRRSDSPSDDERHLFVRLADVGAHGLVLQEPHVANLPRPAVAQR